MCSMGTIPIKGTVKTMNDKGSIIFLYVHLHSWHPPGPGFSASCPLHMLRPASCVLLSSVLRDSYTNSLHPLILPK